MFKFDLYGVGTVTGTLPTTGVWHQVAGTYDGTTMRLYVDGTQIGSTTIATPQSVLAVTSDPLMIGTKAPGSTTVGNYFNGIIDDVRIYNYGLSASAMQTLAHGTVPGAPLPLLQSIEVVWPQTVGMIAGAILLFVIGYVIFQRQEVRA